MKVQSSMKHLPSKRSKDEIHEMLKKRVADKKAGLPEAKISKTAKSLANGDKKVSRVDPDKSAIGLNDPNSSATKEKLRVALKMGAVKFSPKERKVLANILK